MDRKQMESKNRRAGAFYATPAKPSGRECDSDARFKCGCVLSGGGYGKDSQHFSAPYLCPSHHSVLIDVLVRPGDVLEEGTVRWLLAALCADRLLAQTTPEKP